MKDGWEVRPLGEVAQLLNGRAYKKSELLEEGPHKVLRVGNLFTSQKWYYSDLELPPSKTIDTGDLLYAWSASFGPFRWEGGPAIYHYHIWKVLPDEQQVTRDFLHYYFEWDKERIQEEQGAGATMLHVSKKSMEARAAPLPPLEEQRRIVAVLDEAFEGLARARANIEANLADADGTLRAVSVELCRPRSPEDDQGWEEYSLGDICRMYQPKTIGRKDMTDDGEYVVFGANGPIGRYHAYNHEEPQLLVTCRGATCGEVNVSAPFSWITGNAMVVAPLDDRVDRSFLEVLFRYGTDFDEVITGAAQPQITRKSLAPLRVSVPSRTSQERITTAIYDAASAADDLRETYTAQLADLDALRQSLLARAFRGELT